MICGHTDTPAISKLRFAYKATGFLGVVGVLLGKFDASIRKKAAEGLRDFRDSVENPAAATQT